MEIYEVVTKLLGSIKPVGSSEVDNERFENLKQMTALVDKLVSDIDDVAMCEENYQASMKKAGKYASEFLTNLGIEE